MKRRINSLAVGMCLIVSLCWIGPVAAQVTLEVLSPRGELPPEPKGVGLSPRIMDLAGKKIALVDNLKAGAELFLTKIEEQLRQKYPTATILRFKKPAGTTITKVPDLYPEVARQCDAFILATGD